MLTYVGRGYTPAFTANMDAIVKRLAKGETIHMVEGADDICAPVMSAADTHCFDPSVTDRDRMVIADVETCIGISLREGAEFTLTPELLSELRAFNAADTFAGACLGCQWKDLCADIAGKGYPGTKLHMP